MPRTLDEIVEHAEELARIFEDHTPDPDRVVVPQPLREVGEAFLSVAVAEDGLRGAVTRARNGGHSWAEIGAMVGTSAEAARQRYGRHRTHRRSTRAAS